MQRRYQNVRMVSIPQGTIKSAIASLQDFPSRRFQFHKVRLKEAPAIPAIRIEFVSIPQGTIKRNI